VTALEVLELLAIGAAGGIVSTVASIATAVSYPALLALGLPPLRANMTNTVALLFTAAGAAAGSRRELAGQWGRVRRLGLIAALGGATGAALLLLTPPDTFVRVAPILIGAASLALLAPRSGRRARSSAGPAPAEAAGVAPDAAGGAPDAAGGAPDAAGRHGGAGRNGGGREGSRLLLAAVFAVAAYVGYFGAAGGVLMLAVLMVMLPEPPARANAVKNVISGLANGVAAAGFAVFGHVDWAVVPPLAAGFLAGGWIGPALARRLPGRALRIGVGVCGAGVALKLGLSAYG
jgi:uncharacterized membrane protein YfcA